GSFFFFSSRRRHTRCLSDWSSDVCSSDLTTVWASHGDKIAQPPPGFRVTAVSANAPVAGMRHEGRPLYGVLFHPEVAHTPRGGRSEERRVGKEGGPRWGPEQ